MVLRGDKWGIPIYTPINTNCFGVKEVDLIYPEESYKLIGLAYNVYNSIGYGHHERNYQRAYAVELTENNFSFKREVCIKIVYKNKQIGRYFLDFFVNNKIVIELKVGKDFHSSRIKQVLNYLHATNKRLGIIFLFTPEGLRFKRIVN